MVVLPVAFRLTRKMRSGKCSDKPWHPYSLADDKGHNYNYTVKRNAG